MSQKPYISERTRQAAMRAIDDLPTDVLLDAMRVLPLSDYRRKELDEAYEQDLLTHRKTFSQEPPKRREEREIDPARLLAAMSYANAPEGPKGGSQPEPKKMHTEDAPDQGVSTGPVRVKKPDLPEGELRVYDGMKVTGAGHDQAAAEGGAE